MPLSPRAKRAFGGKTNGGASSRERALRDEAFEALDVVLRVATEALLRTPLEHVAELGDAGAVEREAEMLIEHVGLERARMPPTERNGIEGAVGDAADRAHEGADWIERNREANVGDAHAAKRVEEDRDRLKRERAAREVIRASDRDDAAHRAEELGGGSVTDQATERMTDEERRALVRMREDLFDGDREILTYIFVDATRCLGAKVA